MLLRVLGNLALLMGYMLVEMCIQCYHCYFGHFDVVLSGLCLLGGTQCNMQPECALVGSRYLFYVHGAYARGYFLDAGCLMLDTRCWW